MPNTYTITVQNNSGATQHYAIFNEPPEVSSTVSSKVWNNALKVANAGPGDSTTFTITSQYFAYVGSSTGVPGQDNVAVNVSNSKAVEVGTADLQGNAKKGTTLFMDIIEGAPQYPKSLDASGKPGAFAINTAPVLPTTASPLTTPRTTTGSLASPNCTYQIQPINKWYITYGSYTSGQVMNVEMAGLNKATVDFTTGSANARVVHSDGGQITTQNSSD
ncbi:unnamed protein product [Clonostachys rosea f. rosea IK726]|uniref:Uncharacterized protein n=1 Tax=Clonostachys rosea f. rosea IK726 TaxID=1349383 RepID=A0ACA9UDE5_BIOOC|nr:unnamed protein product [Clonostachys rosea f. rosea IK726]